MFHFADHELDAFLTEDIPYIDLTTLAVTRHDRALLEAPVVITYRTRQAGVVCGTEELRRMLEKSGATVTEALPSGTTIQPGDALMQAQGPAASLFAVWKVGQNLLEHASGIASSTRRWAEIVAEAGRDIPILTTRKIFPGTKKLAVKAVMTGGAVPHRLGVSETILIFAQHIELAGGMDVLYSQLPSIKRMNCEKKILVETEDLNDARKLLEAGVDGIQFDKVPSATLATWVSELHARFPAATLLAAGNITEKNLVEYAHTGVDGIVTSSLYHSRPLDIGVTIERAADLRLV